MGPHFFKCGKLFDFESKQLRLRFFNGAALFQVRKVGDSEWTVAKEISLQWGRTFSSAERIQRASEHLLRRRSSMGPHFFKCGKRGFDRANKQSKESSMGPHFFKCGKPPQPFFPHPHIPVFNGAALFQVRKAFIAGECKRNGKPSSMGPHFFKCGKWVGERLC